jgi:hypothetical protein
MGSNATVFWVRYPPAQINKNETWGSVGETRIYQTNVLINTVRHFLPESGINVFDKLVYPDLVNLQEPSTIYENFHPSLGGSNGDLFVVMFEFTVPPWNVPLYVSFQEAYMHQRNNPDNAYVRFGSSTSAIHCTEQYQLCLYNDCTG